MVSIITPSFNSSQYIEDTYKGIIQQSTPDWEWIVVDDGSSDTTLALLHQYAASDSRIKFFQRNREPKGATTCRNIAIEKCTGDYLIFLDTDDIPASFCFEQRTNEMKQNPGCDFIIFQMLSFNERPGDLALLWNVEDGRDDLERAIRMNPVMAGSSTIWKKESFVKIGLWDDRILLNQDIELHIRAIVSGCRYLLRLNLPPDIFVRNNQQSISRATKKTTAKQLSRVYYFSKVLTLLKDNNLLYTYRPALKWLFLKLFLDLHYDGESAIAKQLFTTGNTDTGLSGKEKLLCHTLLMLGKMSKPAVAAIRFLNRRIMKGKNINRTHGQLLYDKPIRY
jgi:glycosyltransferase involved in cell wall biosynthesis